MLNTRIDDDPRELDDFPMPIGDLGFFSTTTWYLRLKTSVDFVASLLMLAVLWPIILLLMILVKATSRGPALYTQARMGAGGRIYKIYKLRTMVHDCERTTGPRWAMPKDPRVTPFGRFLRCSHLDELPQLWNVVRLEMSLVGPRPERPEFVRQLARVIPRYLERTYVRPGITGLAQIQLPADEEISGVRSKVKYDLYYIREMSPWLDLKIVAGTSLKVLGARFSLIRELLCLPDPEVVFSGNVQPRETAEQDLPSLVEVVS
jgi:lipopolysaccharide/colanic/teichoic acid biosynthesis glycosyltransferase